MTTLVTVRGTLGDGTKAYPGRVVAELLSTSDGKGGLGFPGEGVVIARPISLAVPTPTEWELELQAVDDPDLEPENCRWRLTLYPAGGEKSVVEIAPLMAHAADGVDLEDCLASVDGLGPVWAESQLAAETARAIAREDAIEDDLEAHEALTATAHGGVVLQSTADLPGGYAKVDSGTGRINPVLVPAIAISDTHVVASQAAMLALSAQTGDIAVRTDESKSYILAGDDPSTLGDWQELVTPPADPAGSAAAAQAAAIAASVPRGAIEAGAVFAVRAWLPWLNEGAGGWDSITIAVGTDANAIPIRGSDGQLAAPAPVKTIPETTYTIQEADLWHELHTTSNDPVTLIWPTGLPVRGRVDVKQAGNGPVTNVGDGMTFDSIGDMVTTVAKNAYFSGTIETDNVVALVGALA